MHHVPVKERKERGLCRRCGKNAQGKSFCPECYKKNEARRKEVRAQRKKEGICTYCGKPVNKVSNSVCEDCSRKYGEIRLRKYRAYRKKNLCGDCGKPTKAGQARCDKCLDRQNLNATTHYENAKARGTCHLCGLPVDGKIRCPSCDDKAKARQKPYRERLRDEVFAAYGGPVCVGCGCDEVGILQMDHIDGGGTKHLKEIGPGQFYRWLRQQGFPEGFRVLCPNCNRRAAAKLPLPKDKQNDHQA